MRFVCRLSIALVQRAKDETVLNEHPASDTSIKRIGYRTELSHLSRHLSLVTVKAAAVRRSGTSERQNDRGHGDDDDDLERHNLVRSLHR